MEEEKLNPFDYIHSFGSRMLYPRHRELIHKAYKRFPKKVKEKLEKNRVMICDWFWKAKNPELRISGMPIGFYNVKSKLIDIFPEKTKIFSDDGFIGFIAHETAHAIISNSFNPIRKIIFKIKFNNLPPVWKEFFKESEDLHADWLAKKWGFEKEIDAMNDERQIIPSNQKNI